MVTHIAIGDIHGMAEPLTALLARLPAEGLLVFLGDYIDRGPESQQVVKRLMALAQERACIFLRGNHEAMALAALDGDRNVEDMWYQNGGLRTIESYSYHLPDDHLAFLRATLPYYETADFIFVHGGLTPGETPQEMAEEELWWMRDPFLSTDYQWGKLVIHGHTPLSSGKPDIRANRINIDTSAVYGGALTALLLPEKHFISEKTLRPAR